MTLGGVKLADVLERFGSPLFVVDAARLEENVSAFRHVPANATSGVECYYSYKTNPIPGVLTRLHALGVGAEVVSEYELWLARRLGVPGERIVCNGPARSRAALRTAVEIGALYQVNHREEIPALVDTARALGKSARVSLRVALSRGWGGQFGEPVLGGAALETYRELRANPELDVVGLHAHAGGELSTVTDVRSHVRELLDFSAALREKLGLTISILDLGGSLASSTVSHHVETALRLNRTFGVELEPRRPEEVLQIRAYVEEVVGAVEDRCRRERAPRPRLLVEPGRSMTGNAQLLLCKVLGFKASGASGLPHVVLDAGINIAEPMRGEYHQIFVAGPESPSERTYRLVGPICTPMDTLAWARRMPDLSPGDVLAVMDAGAYFVPFSTSFSFPQPGIAVIEDGRAHLLRRAETFEDLVRRDETASAAGG